MSGAVAGVVAGAVGTKVLKYFAGVKYYGEVIGVVRPDVDEPDGEDWYKVRYDDEDEEMLDARELLLHARQFREFVAAQPAAMVDAEPNELCGGHHLSVGTLMDMLGVMGGPCADSDDADDSEVDSDDSEVDSDDSEDSGADSEVGEDVAEGAEEHKNEDGVDRRTFPPTKGGSFVAEPRPTSQAGQHGRWSRWDAVLWGCRVNNFESAAGLPVSHVVRSFDKGVHAAAAVALTYPRGVYAPVIRKRPHVYDLQTSEAERNAAVAQFEQQIKAGRFIKSDRPCRRQYDVFAQVSARRGVDAFSDVRVYSALLLPIRTQLLATGLVKVAGGGFAFTKNAAMSKAVTEAIEHHDGQAPHSHPRPSSRVRVRLIVSVSKTAESAHPLSTRWSPEYGGDLGTKGGGLEFYAPLAASVTWIMYDTNIQQTHCARPAAEDGTRLLCTEDYEVILPPAEVGDLAALLAALEKLRARIPGIMKAAHPGSVRVQPTTASGGEVAPEMPIAWEKGGLALKPRRERRRVKAVPLAQAELCEQQQREQRQRERDERRQRKRDERRQRKRDERQRKQQRKQQREQERREQRLRLDRLWAEAEGPPVVAVVSVVEVSPATGAPVGDVIEVQISQGLVEAARRALMRQEYARRKCQNPEPRVHCRGPIHRGAHRCVYCEFLAPPSAGSEAENAAEAMAELQPGCLTAELVKAMSRKVLERHLATYPADAMSPIGALSQFERKYLEQQLLRRNSADGGATAGGGAAGR